MLGFCADSNLSLLVILVEGFKSFFSFIFEDQDGEKDNSVLWDFSGGIMFWAVQSLYEDSGMCVRVGGEERESGLSLNWF